MSLDSRLTKTNVWVNRDTFKQLLLIHELSSVLYPNSGLKSLEKRSRPHLYYYRLPEAVCWRRMQKGAQFITRFLEGRVS